MNQPTHPHSANGPWKKKMNFIFPTKYVIPKSLKFSLLGQVSTCDNQCVNAVTKNYPLGISAVAKVRYLPLHWYQSPGTPAKHHGHRRSKDDALEKSQKNVCEDVWDFRDT